MDSPSTESSSREGSRHSEHNHASGRPGRASPTNEHFHAPQVKGIKRFSRKSRKATKETLQPFEGWEQPAGVRLPYHQYVSDLAEAGWDNLRTLDRYMKTDIEDKDLVVSVLDILDDYQLKRWADMHDGLILKQWMEKEHTRRGNVKVRLYMVEQKGDLATGVIEALGGSLDLDPRFFQWSLKGSRNVLSPSDHHRAPYLRIGFGVPKLSTPLRTDAEKFKVTVYVKPEAADNSRWTGVFLFTSHTKMDLSTRNLTSPPSFSNKARPSPISLTQKSFRELYLDTFSYINLEEAAKSPFYATSQLFRLNCFCWGRVINSIRDEDHRINGVSDTSVGHAEEIQKSMHLVQRSGSLGWHGRDGPLTVETRQRLEEDFTHLIEQTQYLWQTREKMEAIRRRKAETRWNSLTNTFTYVFAPVTIISGVYGMNVSEISGSDSNPNIWQFFAAIAILNLTVLLVLAFSNWLHIMVKHGRRAGIKECMGFAVGRANK